ncbi:DHHW family protein [Desulfitobacterium sp. PCE1]|uniref:DHHW family protein n=1 Tax=Desulfitobacterium sp. PCE1 TaxID=146907 RepID=UPI00035DB254|nr:DHHW family protein [Desulfitobacterium sp. PCE1]
MTERGKNRVVVLSFFLVLWGFFAASVILKDEALSVSERRKLAGFPELSVQSVFSGELAKELEEYLLDQFPARDDFRRLKAHFSLDILRKKENNGIYLVGDGVYKLEYPLNEGQVSLGAQKINDLYDKYLTGMKVYYGVIPDKNYYVAEENKILAMDYAKMREKLSLEIDHTIKEIELFDCLKAEDYYRTDPHWRQENLGQVVARLAGTMGVDLPPLAGYDRSSFAPFYGAYYGQSALSPKPDEIIYLQSETIANSTLYNLEKNRVTPLYTLEAAGGMDAYDLFLSGASAFLVLENKKEPSGRELIIFRDSFASSLAPLLLEGYSKITLIDLRYMDSKLLPQFITFTDQDVLFLYSTLVFNHSAMLR